MFWERDTKGGTRKGLRVFRSLHELIMRISVHLFHFTINIYILYTHTYIPRQFQSSLL